MLLLIIVLEDTDLTSRKIVTDFPRIVTPPHRSGVHKRVVSKRVVLADVPWTPKTGRRYKKRNKMTVPKTGTRVHKTERRYQKPE